MRTIRQVRFVACYFLLAGVMLTLTGVSYSSAAVLDELFRQGKKDFQEENYEEALGSLFKVHYEEPESAETHYYIGLTYKEMLNFEESEKFLRKALILDSLLSEAHLHLGEVLYGLKRYSEAEKAAKKAAELGVKPAYTNYLAGLIKMKQSKSAEAVEMFDKAIASGGRLKQKGIYSKGLAYIKLRNRSAARKAFEESIVLDPESGTAELARRALAAMEAKGKTSPLSLSLGYAYQYDDNVTTEPSVGLTSLLGVGAIILDKEDSRQVITLSGQYNMVQMEGFTLRAQYNFYQSLHQDLDQFDVRSNSLSFVPSMDIDGDKINLPVSFSHVTLDDKTYLKTVSIRPSYSFPMGEKRTGIFSLGIIRKDYPAAPLFPDEDRNADNFSLGFNCVVAGSQNGWGFNGGISVDRDNTDGRNWEYDGARLNLQALYPLRPDIALSLMGDYYYQEYKNIHSSFGLKRRDRTMTGSATLSYAVKKVLLTLQYTYVRDDSNTVEYEYHKNSIGAGLILNF